jgi:hypothetical protein
MLRPRLTVLFLVFLIVAGCKDDPSGPSGPLSMPITGPGPKRGTTFTYWTEMRSNNGQLIGMDSTLVEVVTDRIDYAGKRNVRRMVSGFEQQSGYYAYDGAGNVWWYDVQYTLGQEDASRWIKLPLDGRSTGRILLIDTVMNGDVLSIFVEGEFVGNESLFVNGRTHSGKKIRFTYTFDFLDGLERQKGTFTRTQTWLPDLDFYGVDTQPMFEDGPMNPGSTTSTLTGYTLPI